MKHWKHILGLVLMVVLLLGTVIQSATITKTSVYKFSFVGDVGNKYIMLLPNTYPSTPEGNPDSFSTSQTIGSVEPRPYKIRGHYRVWFNCAYKYFMCFDKASFSIDGISESVFQLYPSNNPLTFYEAAGDFEIPANASATVTYNAGMYLSKDFWGRYSSFGVNGGWEITLYYDSDEPDKPANIRCDGNLATKLETSYACNGTVTLSWDPPRDKPYNSDPVNECEASGIRGYKIYDGVMDITPIQEEGSDTAFIAQTSQTITLAGEGNHEIKIYAYDYELNESQPAEVNINVDQTPPTGSFVIDNDNEFTGDPEVTLYVTQLSDNFNGITGSGVAQVGFSIDNQEYTWIDYNQTQPPSPQNPFTVSNFSVPADVDGEKTVYMKLKDKAGNITPDAQAVSDKIILDTTAPTITDFKINNGAPNTASLYVNLTLSAFDTSSGIAGMMISNDDETYSAQTYSESVFWPLHGPDAGDKAVFVILTDLAGNTSKVSVPIKYQPYPDYTDPTPERTLVGDETWSGNYFVNGRVIVPPGITLTISSGVQVTVGSLVNSDPLNNGFIIEGKLIVESGVSFSTPHEGWMGIIIRSSGENFSQLTGATIRQAIRGLAILNGADVTVTGCTFIGNNAGIHIYASYPMINGCVFQGNTYGIKEDAIGSQRPTVDGCTFTDNLMDYYHDPFSG